MGGSLFFMVFLSVELQHGAAGPVQPRHDRAGTDIQGQRDLLVGKLAVLAHDQHVAQASRQPGDGAAHDGDLLLPAGLALRGAAVHGVPLRDGELRPARFFTPCLVKAGVARDAHDPGQGVGPYRRADRSCRSWLPDLAGKTRVGDARTVGNCHQSLPHLELKWAAPQPQPQRLILAAGKYPMQPVLCLEGPLDEVCLGP